jgi:invasion protein IalB
MYRFLPALPLALVWAMTGAALAQDTQTPSAPEDQVQTEAVGDWNLQCVQPEDQPKTCQLHQLMDDGEGAPIAEITLFRLPQGGQAVAGATVIVPLETALPNQLRISVDDGPVKTYPYAFCNSVGCYARIGLTTGDIADFQGGNLARLIIVPARAPDQIVTIDMSLKGFTAGYDQVTVLSP